MSNPFFSIIIPTKDRPDFLRTCVNSVLEQSFTDFEMIIVNDGDNYGLSLINNSDIKQINNSGRGICAARNKGMNEALGHYLIFLDDDEYFESNHLKSLAEFYKQNQQKLILKTGTKLLANSGFVNEGKFSDRKSLLPQVWKYGASMSDYCFPSEIKALAAFDETVKITNDFLFLNQAFCFFPQQFLDIYSIIIPDHSGRISYKKFLHPSQNYHIEINVIRKCILFTNKNKQFHGGVNLSFQLEKLLRTTSAYSKHCFKMKRYFSAFRIIITGITTLASVSFSHFRQGT